ncbi:MAG: hypothetical protein R3F31_04470 [Verrucomicrobiales bacterium]
MVLNSASPSLYVGEIAAALGFHHWVATRMEASDPMPFFPRIDGPNNKHGAKIDAMRESCLLPVGFDATGGLGCRTVGDIPTMPPTSRCSASAKTES